DSAVGGHDLSHHRRFFGVAITLRTPQGDGRFRSGRQYLWAAARRTACPCSCVCSIGPSRESVRSRMVPSEPKPLRIWPRKWESRSSRSILRRAIAISWSSSIPPTATTSPNSRWRWARMEACAPAPLAFGLRPNFKSSYLSCHRYRGETQRGGGTRGGHRLAPTNSAEADRPHVWTFGRARKRLHSARSFISLSPRGEPIPSGRGPACRDHLSSCRREQERRGCPGTAPDRAKGVSMRVTNAIARVLAACAGLFAAAALAQSPGYPDRPVKIIVPFAAAGPTDVVARLIALKLSEKYGQQFYIENMAGAGGNLGMGAAAKAPADGYTILFVSSSYTGNPSLYAKPPYDPDKDFVPVTKAAGSPNGLFVHPSIPAKSVKELVELIKANPGKYTFASPGIGTTPHLSSELFKLTFGLDFALAPFPGGGQ